jgi:hypothetical protein
LAALSGKAEAALGQASKLRRGIGLNSGWETLRMRTPPRRTTPLSHGSLASRRANWCGRRASERYVRTVQEARHTQPCSSRSGGTSGSPDQEKSRARCRADTGASRHYAEH